MSNQDQKIRDKVERLFSNSSKKIGNYFQISEKERLVQQFDHRAKIALVNAMCENGMSARFVFKSAYDEGMQNYTALADAYRVLSKGSSVEPLLEEVEFFQQGEMKKLKFLSHDVAGCIAYRIFAGNEEEKVEVLSRFKLNMSKTSLVLSFSVLDYALYRMDDHKKLDLEAPSTKMIRDEFLALAEEFNTNYLQNKEHTKALLFAVDIQPLYRGFKTSSRFFRKTQRRVSRSFLRICV